MMGQPARLRSSRRLWIRVFPAALGALGVGLIVVCATFWQASLRADVTAPTVNDRNLALIVTRLMEDQHLSRHALNDEISERAFKSFFQALDPMKLYFLQSDMAEFEPQKTQLDDMLRNKDVSFAFKVFQRFLQRVDERVKVIDELIDQKQDFTVDEEMVIDRDQLQYPKDDNEARERWRKRIKYDLLVLKGDKTEGEKAKERLHRRYQNFRRRMHQFDNNEVLETFLTSVTTSYDPHTTYMSPSTLDNFNIDLGLNLQGIGARLGDEDGYAKVVEVVPGGAADKDGKLKPDDRIVSVGQGESGEMVDTVNTKLNDVVKLIRGQAGTVVRLGVIPSGSTETKIYTITRATIELTDSAAHGEILEAGSNPDGRPYRLGVIDLPSFYLDMEAARKGTSNFRSTTRDVRAILDDFKAKNVDGVVLDLRRNGGGSLSEAIDMTGLFIDQGPVVQVKGPDNNVEHYDDVDRGMAWDGPLVVMTSKLSASASEIFAGAIQDYGRGLIVGDKTTHGKGTVQSLLELGPRLIGGPRPPNLGALKITIQQFFRPNGDSTQKRGVLADIVLPSITDNMDISESDLDYAIDFQRVRKARFAPVGLVTPEEVNHLQTASGVRVRQSEEFQKLLTRIDRFREQKKRKTVTLNEQKFFAEREKFNADKEEEKQLDERSNANNAINRDFYLNEVLAIATDYIQELRGKRIAKTN